MKKTQAELCKELSNALGQRAISERLPKVGQTAVSNAVVRGAFPSSWYLAVRALCDERGIECPDGAFNFKVDH